jgi:hypothetical protein
MRWLSYGSCEQAYSRTTEKTLFVKSIWHHHHFIITSFDNHHVVLPWLCYHGVTVVLPQRTLAWEDICTRLLLRFACIQQRHYGLRVMTSTCIKQRLLGLPQPSRRA